MLINYLKIFSLCTFGIFISGCFEKNSWRDFAEREISDFAVDKSAEDVSTNIAIGHLLFKESLGIQDSYYAAAFSIELTDNEISSLCSGKRPFDYATLRSEILIAPPWHGIDSYLLDLEGEIACMEVFGEIHSTRGGYSRARIVAADKFIFLGHEW